MITRELARLGAPDLLAPLMPSPDSVATEAGPAELDFESSTALVALCQRHRLAPILGDAVDTGRIVLAEEVLPELVTSIEHFLATQLRIEQGSMAVLDPLLQAGVDFRVLKGLATAYLDYPNPAMRPTGDLDILIRPEEMPRALEVVAKIHGGELHTTPGNDWRVTHAIPFRLNGIEIDLHHRLLHQAAGHCASRLDLFAEPQQFEIIGRTLLGLPPWLRLVQAASQNVIGGYRQLSSDLDVARLAEHVENARARAANVGLGWVVTEGIRASQGELAWGPEVQYRDGLSWRDRGFRRMYGGASSSVLERSAFELAMARPTATAAIMAAALRPGDEYLEYRGRSSIGQFKRQLRRLRTVRR